MRNYLYMIIWFIVFVFCEGTAGILAFTAWTLDNVESIARQGGRRYRVRLAIQTGTNKGGIKNDVYM